ncbi:MAG: hypothetical protein QOG15_2130 [Solirubrobacteraceae bacterium]|nr:hypothetical protein [Solirubrobacteraceae bacterium]
MRDRAFERLRADTVLEALRVIAPAVLFGLAIAVFGWADMPLSPAPGLDPSWQAAMHMGIRSDLVWGRDLVYTYGPLGFLRLPTYWYGATGAMAFVYETATRVALFALLWQMGRRSFGWLGSALLLLVMAPLVAVALPPLIFAWAVRLLVEERDRREVIAFAVLAAALGSVEVLIKINVGASILAIGAVALLFVATSRDPVRLLAVFCASAVVALVAAWLLAGQPLAALPDFVSTASQIVSGYSEAMMLDDPLLRWQYSAALLLFLLGLSATWVTTPELAPGRRLGVAALWTVLAFFSFKTGFVRQGVSHGIFYFGALLPALMALPWDARLRFVGLATMAVALAALLVGSSLRINDVIAPLHRAGHAIDQTKTLLSPNERAQIMAAGRKQILITARLQPATAHALDGHTVHVVPTDTAIVWAATWRWTPLPVPQNFQAYTSDLDHLNAEKLRRADAPERILMRPRVDPDGRIVQFDTPEATRAMLCRYRPVTTQSGPAWIVLARGAQRCGAPRPIGTVSARWAETVRVPAAPSPNAMVFVRIQGVQVAGLERLRTMLFKARERTVTLNGSDTHRLTPGTAGDGIVLSVPRGADYPPPFNQAYGTLTIATDRAARPDGVDLRYEFFEMPIAPLR